MERVEYGTDGNPYKLFVSTGIENKEQFPTVIPKAYAQNAIEEALKDTSENVLAIVREEYISKADYETRLKADMVAMLTELKNKLIEKSWNIDMYDDDLDFECCYLDDIDEIIQQEINALKGAADDQD